LKGKQVKLDGTSYTWTGNEWLDEHTLRPPQVSIQQVAAHYPQVTVAHIQPLRDDGRPTFVDDLLARCGFDNTFSGAGNGRYPQVTAAVIRAVDLDAILLSSDPFPFSVKP
jgi:hypothetical protein